MTNILYNSHCSKYKSVLMQKQWFILPQISLCICLFSEYDTDCFGMIKRLMKCVTYMLHLFQNTLWNVWHICFIYSFMLHLFQNKLWHSPLNITKVKWLRALLISKNASRSEHDMSAKSEKWHHTRSQCTPTHKSVI